MVTRSMDEVRSEYMSSMGQELGASFYELHRKLVELHVLGNSTASFSAMSLTRSTCLTGPLACSSKSFKTSCWTVFYWVCLG